MRRFAASSPRTCCRHEDHRPDRRHRHGKIHCRRRLPPRAHSGVRRRSGGAPDAGQGRPRGQGDRGRVSRAPPRTARSIAPPCGRRCSATGRRLPGWSTSCIRWSKPRSVPLSERARRAGRRAVVLDIPLLFETKGDKRVDTIVVVSAPRAVQIHRVGLRRRMSKADIEAVIARQMPDREKRRRADLVVQDRAVAQSHLANPHPLHPEDCGHDPLRPVRYGNNRPGPAERRPRHRGRGAGVVQRPADRQAFPCADRPGA